MWDQSGENHFSDPPPPIKVGRSGGGGGKVIEGHRSGTGWCHRGGFA
jgi:hypothetical protein